MSERRADGNCRACGALFQSPEHNCNPPNHSMLSSIRLSGLKAIEDHIASLSDQELADCCWIAGKPLGGSYEQESRTLIKEITKRFCKLAELQERY